MNDKRRLGRGLEALIPGITNENPVREISLDKIKANPYQPRTEFDQDKLKDLANSIAEHGIIQPVIVSSAPDGYELVAGERRYRAAQIVGLEKIPCIVKNVDSENKIKVALVENLQREDLNPVEEAKAYNCLIEEFGFTQEKISKSLGKSRSAIANTLRLLSLPTDIQQELASGKLNAGQARTLLAVKDRGLLREMAKEIIEKKITVREIEKSVSEATGNGKKSKKTGSPQREDIFKKELSKTLQMYLGTKVKIVDGKKRGSIEIEYYGSEDLERITDLITGKKQVF